MFSGSAAARCTSAFVVPWHVAMPPASTAPTLWYSPTRMPPITSSMGSVWMPT